MNTSHTLKNKYSGKIFNKENKLKPLPVLQFFYKHIAPSDKHIDALLRFQDKSKEKQDKYIRSLKIEMLEKNIVLKVWKKVNRFQNEQ